MNTKCVFAKSMHFKIVSHTKLAVFISPRVRFILAWCFVCRALVVNGLAGMVQLLENVVDAALLCSKFEPHVTEGLFRLFPPHYVITITGTHHIETFLNFFLTCKTLKVTTMHRMYELCRSKNTRGNSVIFTMNNVLHRKPIHQK